MGVGTRESIRRRATGVGTVWVAWSLRIANKGVALDTSLPCWLSVFHLIPRVFPCFLCAFLSRPMSAPKKEEKKLLQNACHICDKRRCQAACLVCNVAFCTRFDPHDPCPNAPEPIGIDFGIQPRLAPCEGKCGSVHAKTGDCGCRDEVCGCGYRFNTVPEFLELTQHLPSTQLLVLQRITYMYSPPQAGCVGAYSYLCIGEEVQWTPPLL